MSKPVQQISGGFPAGFSGGLNSYKINGLICSEETCRIPQGKGVKGRGYPLNLRQVMNNSLIYITNNPPETCRRTRRNPQKTVRQVSGRFIAAPWRT